MVHKYFEERQKGSISEFADLNLFIYIVIRDSKLLELREKIESVAQGNQFGQVQGYTGRQIPFLFRICQKYAFDFNMCLEVIRSLESDVYLPLNKIAKELGLKESHQYMFEIFNQVDEGTAMSTSSSNSVKAMES